MNEKRLLKLADFLDALPREEFDFSSVVQRYEHGCGAVCCAIGWTPKVFPRLVGWHPHSGGFKMGEKSAHYVEVASKLFGISPKEADRLFSPERYLPWWRGRHLSNHALPTTVAKSIRKFVEWSR